MYTYRFKHQGFTIVELLVMIVVITILMTLGVSGYSNLQQRAANTSRVTEIVAWKKVFMIYRNLKGEWPPSMVVDEEYCLGSGYPIGAGGVPRCHNYQSSGAAGSPDYAVRESDNATLMAELQQYVDLPKGGDRTPIKGIVGPYVRLKVADGEPYLRLTMVQNGDVCPSETELYWRDADGSRSTCIIEVE